MRALSLRNHSVPFGDSVIPRPAACVLWHYNLPETRHTNHKSGAGTKLPLLLSNTRLRVTDNVVRPMQYCCIAAKIC